MPGTFRRPKPASAKDSNWLEARAAANEHDDRLVGKSRQPKSIVQFFWESPLACVELNAERDLDRGADCYPMRIASPSLFARSRSRVS
jgi:hypothetical protein